MEDLIHFVGPLAVLFFLLLGLAFTVFSIMGIWKMFEKADQPGWGILVPIYNLILIVRVAGLPEWMFLLLLIPVVNIVANDHRVSGNPRTVFKRGWIHDRPHFPAGVVLCLARIRFRCVPAAACSYGTCPAAP